MTVKKAVLILEEFIRFKQICIEKMEQDRFKTDVEEIRKTLVNLHAGDKRVLEAILLQLKSTKKESKEKLDNLSFEIKKEIAYEVKKAISNYKKSYSNSKQKRNLRIPNE